MIQDVSTRVSFELYMCTLLQLGLRQCLWQYLWVLASVKFGNEKTVFILSRIPLEKPVLLSCTDKGTALQSTSRKNDDRTYIFLFGQLCLISLIKTECEDENLESKFDLTVGQVNFKICVSKSPARSQPHTHLQASVLFLFFFISPYGNAPPGSPSCILSLNRCLHLDCSRVT